MRRLRINLLIVLLLSFLLCWPCERSIAQTDDTRMANVINALATAERQLLNLTMEGGYRSEIQENGQWKPTPVEIQVKGWFNGMAGGPERVDVVREVLQYIGDDVPPKFAVSSFSVSWNGHSGKVIRYKAGSLDTTVDYPIAETSSKRPRFFTTGAELIPTGGGFSNYFHSSGDGKSLSAFLLAQLKQVRANPDPIVTIEDVTLDATKAIKITLGRKNVISLSWWLDPQRNYAILRSEDTIFSADGKPEGLALHDVIRLKELSSGVWYPTEAVYEYPPIKKGDPPARMHYLATKVVANDPMFDNKIFDVSIPESYLAHDLETGKRSLIAPTTRELDADLKAAADEAIKAATQPDGATP